MTDFKDKLNQQFNTFSLKAPNQPFYLKHLYADYVELMALFSNESYITASELLDRLQDEGIITIKDTPESFEEIYSDIAEQLDGQEAKIDGFFRLIEERALLFEEQYPFNIDANGLILKEELNYKHELYLMLLIASNLNLFSKVQTELTSEFETISYYVLKNFLPNSAMVMQFGENCEYDGNAKSKIQDLASDLKVDINEYELNQIPDENTKERGLDIVGWIPFDDNIPNFIAVLGQCACGKEWYKKQNETRRFEQYLRFYKLTPVHSLFIPYSIIEVSKGFYQSDEITTSNLMFERKRIVDLFNDEEAFSSLLSKQIVSKAIEFEEDIV